MLLWEHDGKYIKSNKAWLVLASEALGCVHVVLNWDYFCALYVPLQLLSISFHVCRIRREGLGGAVSG